jgi:hypothetical protein
VEELFTINVYDCVRWLLVCVSSKKNKNKKQLLKKNPLKQMSRAFDSISDSVLRVSVKDLQKALEDDDNYSKRPSVYVTPGVYVGYDVDELERNVRELRRWNHREVIDHTTEVLKVKCQPYIDNTTTIIISPDHWDRRLPIRYQQYAEQLDVLPFSALLHFKNKDYKKLIPPRAAVEIMRRNALLRRLSMDSLLLALPGSGGATFGGGGDDGEDILANTRDDSIPEDLRGFDFYQPQESRGQRKKTNSNKKRRHRRSKGSSSKKKSTKKKTTSRRGRRRTGSSKKKRTAKAASKSLPTNVEYARIMARFHELRRQQEQESGAMNSSKSKKNKKSKKRSGKVRRRSSSTRKRRGSRRRAVHK